MAESSEAVAYELLEMVIKQKAGRSENPYAQNPDEFRKWCLDAYAECLLAVRSPEKRIR